MNNIQEMTDLLTKLKNSNIAEDIINLNDMYKNLAEKYSQLMEQNKILEEQLKKCNDMYSDLNKVSYVRSLSIELQNKNVLIKQLESQIEKQKINKISENDSIEKELEKARKREEEYKAYNFNINDYEDIDEFELIKYKKVYYLKNSNNSIYSILNNKPYLLVGTININGKVVLV